MMAGRSNETRSHNKVKQVVTRGRDVEDSDNASVMKR